MKAIGPMLAECRTITTSTGNTLQWPTWDDTSNEGEWLSISSDSTTGAAPTFGQVVFNANVVSSKQVLVPVQLLQDSAFDMQAELSDAFAIRLARAINKAITLGNSGAAQPAGLLIGITNIVNATGGISSGNTDLNSLGVDDLSNLIAALDPAYRAKAKFMGAMSTFDSMRKMKDSLGRPLWVASVTQGQPDTIFGYPWFFNQAMDAIGAGKKPLVFGDFSKYVVRNVLGYTLVRFNELYMTTYNCGFQMYGRVDGQILQPAAFCVAYNPAS